MKKPIYLLIALLNICSCTERKAATDHADLPFDNLNGPVTKTEVLSFKLDSVGKISGQDSCCAEILEYDSTGHRARQSSVDISNLERSGQHYTRRFPNGLVKEIEFIQDGKVLNIMSSTLKADNYYHARIRDSNGKLLSFYDRVVVNEYGKIISMTLFNTDSSIQQIVTNNYEEHIWVGGSIKDSSGKDIFSSKIKLNERLDPAEVIEITFIDKKPVTNVKRYVYDQYDAYHNWIQCIETNTNTNERKLLQRRISYRAQ